MHKSGDLGIIASYTSITVVSKKSKKFSVIHVLYIPYPLPYRDYIQHKYYNIMYYVMNLRDSKSIHSVVGGVEVG